MGVFFGKKSALNHGKMVHFKTKKDREAYLRNMLEYNGLPKMTTTMGSAEGAGSGCRLL
jgi:hypothetical protein